MSSDLIARIRQRCSDRGWFGPECLQDSGFQLGPERARYEAGFRWPAATATEVDAAERELGFALPRLFRQMLCEVANGDFGPGYGFTGVRIAAHSDRPVVTEIPPGPLLEMIERQEKSHDRIQEALAAMPLPAGMVLPTLPTRESVLRDLNKPPATIVDAYRSSSYSEREDGPWLQLVTWGCGMDSVLHLPTDRVVYYEPNPGEYVASEGVSLREWLDQWLAGELYGQDMEERADDLHFFTGEDGRDPWRQAAGLDD